MPEIVPPPASLFQKLSKLGNPDTKRLTHLGAAAYGLHFFVKTSPQSGGAKKLRMRCPVGYRD